MTEIFESNLVPDGDMYYMAIDPALLRNHSVILVPKYNQYGERTGIEHFLSSTLLYTRHMLGVQEAARYRRRNRRGSC